MRLRGTLNRWKLKTWLHLFLHLIEHHELPDIVEHVMVLGGGKGHVVNDGGHVAEDGGVQKGRGDHEEKTEQL